MGIMLGIIVVIGILESFLVVPFLPPHAKPGFANIVVMYCIFAIGRRQAFTLNILKSLFVIITRGAIAGLLSIAGGVLSIIVIMLLVRFTKLSFVAISVAGALTHSLGQFAVFMLLMRTPALIYYLPILIISGLISGVLTGTLLTTLLKVKKIN